MTSAAIIESRQQQQQQQRRPMIIEKALKLIFFSFSSAYKHDGEQFTLITLGNTFVWVCEQIVEQQQNPHT